MKKLYIPIIIFMGLSINTFAQEKSHKEKKGDKYYRVYSFGKAIDSYTDSKDITTEGQRRLAASLHHNDQNAEAEIAYAKLVESSNGVEAEDFYNYAMVLKANGKYDMANTTMNKFQTQKPNDLRAKSYATHSGELNNLLKDDGKYKIDHLNVNSDAEDFGPAYYKDKIVFASSRETPAKKRSL